MVKKKPTTKPAIDAFHIQKDSKPYQDPIQYEDGNPGYETARLP